MFRRMNKRTCILVCTILLSSLFTNNVLATTKEGDKLNTFVIGKASVQFEGCNNMHELISSELTILLQNSFAGEDGAETVKKDIKIETDRKGIFVSKLVYPRLSSVNEVRYKDLWQIPLSTEEGTQISYDVTEKGLCQEQGMSITFMEVTLSVDSNCKIQHDTNIFFGPSNEVAELLFHTILYLPKQDKFKEGLEECLEDVLQRRGGETQK